MTAVRDTLCNLSPVEIPRPKCAGFQFVRTRGRMGFYQSIKRDGEKYGVQIKNQGPRRPSLPGPDFWATSSDSRETEAQLSGNGTTINQKNGLNLHENGTIRNAEKANRLQQPRHSIATMGTNQNIATATKMNNYVSRFKLHKIQIGQLRVQM
ncbi:hypothetical protein Ddc_03588 [Ditylenchus destructor]|nr:hypothetical protein Ddc_03588 [Ditylenchus destructor]